MKKILLICIAIIGFMQFASAQAVDVTETVLSNYICPFVSTGVQMHTGNARFMQLGDPWVVEGGVGGVIGDATYTSWHIDTGKAPNTAPYLGLPGGSFTITPGWDGFLGTFSDMKAYQTVTLDPGYYEFTATKAEQDNAKIGVYLVAAKGAGIPNYADVANGLAATPFSLLAAPDYNVTVGFNITETTQVSLGCVATFVGKQLQLTIAGFRLTKTEGVSVKPLTDKIAKIKAFTAIQYPVAGTYAQTQWDAMQADVTLFQNYVDNAVYTDQPEVDAKVAQLVIDIHKLDSVIVFPNEIVGAKALTTIQYPIGIIPGTFSQAKWDALQTAIGVATSFAATTPDSQTAIDASRAALQAAISELNGSMALPFKASDDTHTYWYQLRENRNPVNYMELGDYASVDGLTTYSQALMVNPLGDNTSSNQLFKFVKAPSPSNGYNIYNQAIDGIALTALVDKGAGVNRFIGDTAVTAFQFGRSADASHFTIFTEGQGQVQMNSAAFTTKLVGYWGHNPADPGNQWEFIELLQGTQTDFAALNAIVLKAIAMNASAYPLGNAEYQYPQAGWDAFIAQRTLAVAMAGDAVTNPASLDQAAVDNMVVALQATIDALNASMKAFFVSDDVNKYWYMIHDNRGDNVKYCRIGLNDTYDKQVKLLAGAPAVITDSVLFKFVQTPDGYAIYSKADELHSIRTNITNQYLAANDTLPAQDLTITMVPNVAKYFYIVNPTHIDLNDATRNAFNSYGTDKVYYWSGGTDPGSQWTFVRSELTSQSVKTVSAGDLGIYSKDRRIVCKDATAKLIVTSLLGQRIDARYQVAPGIYVVQIVGKIGAAKLIVR